MQGTGDQGQPLYQAYSITVDPNEPLTINASGGTTLSPGTVHTRATAHAVARGT